MRICVLFLLLCAGAAFAQEAEGTSATVLDPRKAIRDRELAGFLVEAKKHTYASQGDSASVKPLLPGTHQLEYTKGPYLYRDIYVGESTFAGQEIVYESGKPVWTMSYTGYIPPSVKGKDLDGAVKLLHTALMRVSAEEPFRGPRRVDEGGFTYLNHPDGTLDNFHGVETISRGDLKLYQLHYGGGLVR